jgi:hypothetical protein
MSIYQIVKMKIRANIYLFKKPKLGGFNFEFSRISTAGK